MSSSKQEKATKNVFTQNKLNISKTTSSSGQRVLKHRTNNTTLLHSQKILNSNKSRITTTNRTMNNEPQLHTEDLNLSTAKKIGSSQWEQNLLQNSSVSTNPSSQPDLSHVPEWAHFIVHQQIAMAKTITEQATELKVQEGKLQLFQKLIEENEALKTELATYKAKLQYLETQQHQTTTLQEKVANDVSADQDLLLTGTCESRHALSIEEWEMRKAEIKVQQHQQQQQDKETQSKQLKQLEQQMPHHQQQQRHQHKHRHHHLQQNALATSYAKVTGRSITPRKKKEAVQPPSEKLLNWAHRLLTPANDTTAYSFVYMGSPRRTLHSEIRKALRLVGVATERVIDIQFPAHGIVALLIHSSYEAELREDVVDEDETSKNPDVVPTFHGKYINK